MPGMDGAELLARLRACDAESGGSIPVIAVSGYPPKAFSPDFDVFLSKPVAPEVLAGALAHVLGK